MLFSEVSMETIDNLIIDAITTLRDKNKRPDEHSISVLVNVTNESEKDIVIKRLEYLISIEKIINKPYKDKNSYYINFEFDASSENAIIDDNVESGTSIESNNCKSIHIIDGQTGQGNKDVSNLNEELTSLKYFVMEQFSTIKKSIENKIIPDLSILNSNYISHLKEEILYLKEEN